MHSPAAVIVVSLALVLAGCSAAPAGQADYTGAATSGVRLPPAAAVFDYQLGGAYKPAPGAGGVPVIDENWPDELILDVSSADKRDRIAHHLKSTLRGCASSGFDAVEIDNLDSHIRSDGFDFAITEECHRYAECSDYTAVYGESVIDIEYADDLRGTFDGVCADPDSPASTILRDRNLTTPANADYIFARC